MKREGWKRKTKSKAQQQQKIKASLKEKQGEKYEVYENHFHEALLQALNNFDDTSRQLLEKECTMRVSKKEWNVKAKGLVKRCEGEKLIVNIQNSGKARRCDFKNSSKAEWVDVLSVILRVICRFRMLDKMFIFWNLFSSSRFNPLWRWKKKQGD